MTNEKKGAGLEDILNLQGRSDMVKNYLDIQNVEVLGRDTVYQTLLDALGSKKAADNAIKNPKAAEEVRKKLAKNAVDGFYDNRQAILEEILDRFYAERMDQGIFGGLVTGDDELSKTYKSYITAAENLKRVKEGDEKFAKALIKQESEKLEIEIREYFAKTDNSFAKSLSEDERESWLKIGVEAYKANLTAGGYKIVASEEFDNAYKAYQEAFGDDKKKADFARGLVFNLADDGDKGRVEAYKFPLEASAEMRKAA
ncbi:MAG: hypothetical protein KC506_01915 [Nanoarchaeota archaeon]|nr:hypothetical protein [Nanoarchaeota archaeon]